jgi:hypothetical protein
VHKLFCVEYLNEIEDQEVLSHFQCYEVLSQKSLEAREGESACMHQTE